MRTLFIPVPDVQSKRILRNEKQRPNREELAPVSAVHQPVSIRYVDQGLRHDIISPVRSRTEELILVVEVGERNGERPGIEWMSLSMEPFDDVQGSLRITSFVLAPYPLPVQAGLRFLYEPINVRSVVYPRQLRTSGIL